MIDIATFVRHESHEETTKLKDALRMYDDNHSEESWMEYLEYVMAKIMYWDDWLDFVKEEGD